jgi:hypothetical protein
MAAQRIGKLRDSAHGRVRRAKLNGPTDDYFDRLEAQFTNAVARTAGLSQAEHRNPVPNRSGQFQF